MQLKELRGFDSPKLPKGDKIVKYGEIKIEALKLMFVNNGDDIRYEDIEAYEQDDTYSGYLVNMPGSVNRCFSELELKGVLPSKSKTLTASEGVASGAFIRFDLASLITSLLRVYQNFYLPLT